MKGDVYSMGARTTTIKQIIEIIERNNGVFTDVELIHKDALSTAENISSDMFLNELRALCKLSY